MRNKISILAKEKKVERKQNNFEATIKAHEARQNELDKVVKLVETPIKEGEDQHQVINKKKIGNLKQKTLAKPCNVSDASNLTYKQELFFSET